MAFALLAAASTVACRFVAPGVTWIPWVCLLGSTVVLITRRATEEPVVTRILFISFSVRSALALSLFVVSLQHYPILQQLHRPHGLWEFGGDGYGYDLHALKILDAWRAGIDLPSIFVYNGAEYTMYKDLSLLMAVVYAVLGASAIHFILLNAWVSALSGVLAYFLAARLSDRRAAVAAAGLIAFWPSSMLWSAQLLKDPLLLAFVLATLLLIVTWWQRCEFSRQQIDLVDVAYCLTLTSLVFGLTYFRNYLGAFLTVSVGFATLPVFAQAILRRQWYRGIIGAGISIAVGIGTVAGIVIDPIHLLSTRHPELGYLSRGNSFREAGQLEPALADYRRAVQLKPAFAPAYRDLGFALMQQGNQAEAATALKTFLSLEPDENQRRAVNDLLVAMVVPSPPKTDMTIAESTPAAPSGPKAPTLSSAKPVAPAVAVRAAASAAVPAAAEPKAASSSVSTPVIPAAVPEIADTTSKSASLTDTTKSPEALDVVQAKPESASLDAATTVPATPAPADPKSDPPVSDAGNPPPKPPIGAAMSETAPTEAARNSTAVPEVPDTILESPVLTADAAPPVSTVADTPSQSPIPTGATKIPAESRIADKKSAASPVGVNAVPVSNVPQVVPETPPPPVMSTTSGTLARVLAAVRHPASWLSLDKVIETRRAEILTGGSMVASTVQLKSGTDVLVFLPQALAIAFLAPFPWQWTFTQGATGIMRPLSSIEVILIALLTPAIIAACWPRIRRFRPEEWVILLFIATVAIGEGLIMPNIGTLFRLRLQFLFPSLILASTVLPTFAYRIVQKLAFWSRRSPHRQS